MSGNRKRSEREFSPVNDSPRKYKQVRDPRLNPNQCRDPIFPVKQEPNTVPIKREPAPTNEWVTEDNPPQTVNTAPQNSSPLHSVERKERIDPYELPSRYNPPDGKINLPVPTPTDEEKYMNKIKLEKLSSDPDTLPIAQHRESILRLIRDNQVVVISGDTGSGKSTQIPKFILQSCQQAGKHCSIICSQPRRIAATSLTRRVSEELGTTVGNEVGYQISMDKSVSVTTKILFCTTGILVERLIHQGRSLRTFTHIILDEVHERSLEIDLTLILLKKLLPKNPKIRLILMSATFDCQLFSDYFRLKESKQIPRYFSTEHFDVRQTRAFNYDDADDLEVSAPIKEIQGFCYPTNLYYIDDVYKQLDTPPETIKECENAQYNHRPIIGRDIYELAVDLITKIDTQNPKNRETESVLIFLPGFGEIRTLYELFAKKASSFNFWLIPLHSSIKHEEQAKIFQIKDGYRKIVLSTNIAESSITVPDVRFVVDFGLFKESYFDPDTNLESLRLEWCSQANLDQRKGRAGRVRSGYVYRFFKSSFFEELPKYSTPEILRAPLEKLILSIKVYGEPVSLLSLALDPPDLAGVANAIENLRDAGALTVTGGDLMKVLDETETDPSGNITHLGRLYARLPLHFRVSRMLFLAHIFGYLEEGLIMAACMSVRSPFELPIRPSLDGFSEKLEYANGSCSDSLASLFLYRDWKFEMDRGWTPRERRRWETQKHVRGKTLNEIEELVRQLAKRLREYGIKLPENVAKLVSPVSEIPNEDYGEDFDRGRSRYRGDYERSPSRSPSPILKPVKRDDRLMLTAILFGSFYPNYLQTEFSDDRAWAFACNNYHKLEYDPCRTVEVIHLPEDATEYDLRDLFYKCGQIDTIIIENSKAYIQFKHTREKPNLSVIKALKLGSIQKLILGEEDDYRRRESRRRNYRRPYTPANTSNPLGGPFNAFQVSFVSVASKLRTRIPRDSLNSACIDDAFEYSPRFVVACFISKSPNNTDTIASETTMLPPTPLLAPILSLIFVPSSDVMFRVNSNYNKYLGCLVGKKLEYSFDAILTNQDLEKINELRALMNDALTADGIKEPNCYPLRRALLSLCTRRRNPLKVRHEVGAFKAADGRQMNFSNASQSYKEHSRGGDDFQAQPDFLPFDSNDIAIFPPIPALDPPLKEGYDYDSEEDIRQSMISKIEKFEGFGAFSNDDVNRDEPEVVCQLCKAPIAEISTLEEIKNPFTNGIAWRLTKPFGLVFSSEMEDEEYSKKLRKSITYIHCKESHSVGWNEAGRKIIAPDSPVEIHGIHNEVILWSPAAWRDNFAMFRAQLQNKKPRMSYQESLLAPQEFNCPCCEVVLHNKKNLLLHLNSGKHKMQKEEILRKNKYARHT